MPLASEPRVPVGGAFWIRLTGAMVGAATGLAVLLPVSANAMAPEEAATYLEQSLEIAVGRDLTDAEAQALAAETRRALASYPSVMEQKIPVLAETAMAFRQTGNAAARGVFHDTIRQTLTEMFAGHDAPMALVLFAPNDTLVDQHEPGIGLAMSDIYAAAWLRALYEGRFDHPATVTLTEADLQAMLVELKAEYPTLSPPNQQVLTRMNAWAAGVETNWENLSPEERRAATAMSTEQDIPPPETVKKITGSPDIIRWVAGMDLGIDPALAAAYPMMVAFHRSGGTGAAVLPLLARLGQLEPSDADWSAFQSQQMLQNLNGFYSENGTLSGLDGGSAMFGWQ